MCRFKRWKIDCILSYTVSIVSMVSSLLKCFADSMHYKSGRWRETQYAHSCIILLSRQSMFGILFYLLSQMWEHNVFGQHFCLSKCILFYLYLVYIWVDLLFLVSLCLVYYIVLHVKWIRKTCRYSQKKENFVYEVEYFFFSRASHSKIYCFSWPSCKFHAKAK